MLKSLPQQITLPQHHSTDEAWHRAGPEFQQGETRFRTYGNQFDAGVVLPDYMGPGPTVALTHTTTNSNKPPDIRVDDNDKIPLRSVAPAVTRLFSNARYGRNWVSSWRYRKVGVPLPPRRSALLGNSNREAGEVEQRLGKINAQGEPPVNEESSGRPDARSIDGSTEVEREEESRSMATNRDNSPAKSKRPPNSRLLILP